MKAENRLKLVPSAKCGTWGRVSWALVVPGVWALGWSGVVRGLEGLEGFRGAVALGGSNGMSPDSEEGSPGDMRGDRVGDGDKPLHPPCCLKPQGWDVTVPFDR